MQYFVYILYSKIVDRYYIGYTSNIAERLKKHRSKNKGFTSIAIDWTIVYTETYFTKQEAMSRERKIKSWKSKVMIQQLISKIYKII